MYGAENVTFSKDALREIENINNLGLSSLPICIAKTPLSLSGDPKLLGRPSGFTLEIKKIVINNGGGFIVCLTKGINVMPGLPKEPLALKMSISNKGDIKLS